MPAVDKATSSDDICDDKLPLHLKAANTQRIGNI